MKSAEYVLYGRLLTAEERAVKHRAADAARARHDAELEEHRKTCTCEYCGFEEAHPGW